MFPFGRLLKEVYNEGNPREVDKTLNRGKATVWRERKKTKMLGSKGGVFHDVRVYGKVCS